MKKTIITISAALLIAVSFMSFAEPAKGTNAQAAKQECCKPNPDCVCVPTPDGGCVCVPKGSVAAVENSQVKGKSSCPNTPDCVCE